MANAWKITSANLVGAQPIDEASSTQKYPLGTIVHAASETYGAGEFIYLKGVSSTAVGSGVEYDTSFATGLVSLALDKARPVAIAMSACDSTSKYGWYQISGEAVVKKASATSFAAEAGLGITSGLAVAVASGLILNGALVSVAGASGATSVRVAINRPHGPADVS